MQCFFYLTPNQFLFIQVFVEYVFVKSCFSVLLWVIIVCFLFIDYQKKYIAEIITFIKFIMN